jgi:sigma-B regulation protein RsbU (phosphoserine phosphatase)
VVAELSKQLSGDAAAGQTLTLLYGILGLDSREFRFVSAGHPGPVHVPVGSPPVMLDGCGFPVGLGTAKYREQVVRLQPGDRLVLYSEGLTEARNADGEHFGSRRLLSSLEEIAHVPLGEVLNALLENAEGWRGSSRRHEDIAILAAEIASPEAKAGRADHSEIKPDIEKIEQK